MKVRGTRKSNPLGLCHRRLLKGGVLLFFITLFVAGACSTPTVSQNASADTTDAVDTVVQTGTSRTNVDSQSQDSHEGETMDTLALDSAGTDAMTSITSVSIFAWNLWDNGLSPDNLALVQGWAPDIIFFEDLTSAQRFEVGRDTLEAAFGHDATEDRFALISQVAFDAPEMIYDPLISKQLLHVTFTFGQTEVKVFQLHHKNPTHHDSDRVIHQQDIDRILEIVGERTAHEHTILLGDFNAQSPADGATEYTYAIETVLAHGYVDTFKKFHPEPEAFMATKIARSFEGARIDYVFVSADLETMVTDAGVEDNLTYPEHSDHRPVWAELSYDKED